MMPAMVIMFVTALAGLTRAAEPDVVTAKLRVDRTPLVAGQDATLAVQVDVAQGYHIQGAKPYDKFLVATKMDWEKAKFAADGISAQLPRYPVAKDIPAPPAISDAGKLAVYEGTIWILLPIHIDVAAATGPRTLQISLHTQACDHESCQMPTTTKLKVDVQIATAGTVSTLQEKEAFDAANKQKLMPVEAAETKLATTVPATTTSQPAAEPLATVSTAPATTAGIASSTDAELELIRSRPYHAANLKTNEYSVGYLFLLAILGGAILNIMPCVLPVIPLKILSLVQQAHGNRSVAVGHALVFSAGVITLFVALAAALGSYQFFSGQQVIDGEQYSHPIFVLTTALIVLALALSMLGVWTISPPQKVYEIAQRNGPGAQTAAATLDYAAQDNRQGANHRKALVASFMTGVLATLLATPCSAPLLGPVLFWALVHPLPVTMLAFALVGVGMSAPYVFLAAFPAGLNRLPKAGRWSELLKQGLGMVMVGVALYLITRIPDPSVWPWALAAALLVGFVCWAWGQIPSPLMEPGRFWTIRVVVLVLGMLAGLGLYEFSASTGSAQANGTIIQAPMGACRRFRMAALQHDGTGSSVGFASPRSNRLDRQLVHQLPRGGSHGAGQPGRTG